MEPTTLSPGKSMGTIRRRAVDLSRLQLAGEVCASTPHPEDKSSLYHNESSRAVKCGPQTGDLSFFDRVQLHHAHCLDQAQLRDHVVALGAIDGDSVEANAGGRPRRI